MARPSSPKRGMIPLPPPEPTSPMPVPEAIARRRSRRAFAARPLSRAEVATLLWAAQGITDRQYGFRAAPSAGALFPMTVLLVDREGVYEYLPSAHALCTVRLGDVRRRLREAALDQSYVGAAPASLIVAMDESRLTPKYGADAERYCLLEAGHIAQNVLIQATAMGLAAVPVGAFEVEAVAELIGVSRPLEPVYIIPVGHARGTVDPGPS